MVKLQAGPHSPGPEWPAARAAKRPRTRLWGVPPLTRRRARMCRHLQLQDGREAGELDWLAGEDEGCRLSARGGGKGKLCPLLRSESLRLCCCCCTAVLKTTERERGGWCVRREASGENQWCS